MKTLAPLSVGLALLLAACAAGGGSGEVLGPLSSAVARNDKAAVQTLLAQGENPNQPDYTKEKLTPLRWAVAFDRPELAELLIDKGANVNEEGWKLSLLEAAARGGQVGMIDLLVRKGAKTDGVNGYVAVLEAVQHGKTDAALFLMDKGINVGFTNHETGEGLVHEAANQGDVRVLRALSVKLKLDQPDKGGQTPLYLAALNGKLEAVQYLASEGAKIDAARIDGQTPLMAAAYEGHTPVVDFLISKGADVNARKENGWTALLITPEKGQTAAAASLLSHGAQVDAKNEKGFTTLSLAVLYKRTDLARLLVDKGANVNVGVRTDSGSTVPLLTAARNQSTPDLVAYLKAHGAKE